MKRWLTWSVPSRVQDEDVRAAELTEADEQPARARDRRPPGVVLVELGVQRGKDGQGGSTSACRSPNVWSMSTEMSKKSSEIVAEPVMCQGVGPSSEPRSWMPQTPSPNTLTQNPHEISTIK